MNSQWYGPFFSPTWLACRCSRLTSLTHGFAAVDWRLAGEATVADSGVHSDCLVRSMDMKHTFSVLLMGLKFEVSSSNRVWAVSFILVFLLRWSLEVEYDRTAVTTVGSGAKKNLLQYSSH